MLWVKAWAYTVCCTCFLLAIVQSGAAAEKTRSVLKMVAGLYILTVVAAPLLKLQTLNIANTVAGTYVIDTNVVETQVQNQVQNVFIANMEKQLEVELETAGVYGAKVTLLTAGNEAGAIYTTGVQVYIQAGDEEKAAAVLHSVLSGEVEIVINGERK